MPDRSRAVGLALAGILIVVGQGDSCGAGEMQRSAGSSVEPRSNPTYASAPTPSFTWFQLSPDDSTSMASAQLLKTGTTVWSYTLKAHEVLNYYDPPAELRTRGDLRARWDLAPGLSVAVDTRDRAPNQDEIRHGLDVLIHVHADLLALEQRRPYNLHLCVDVSGSMSGDKIEHVREALDRLLAALRPGDRLSLSTFATAGVLLQGSVEVARHRARLEQLVAALEADGSTNMIAGLRLAYAEAERVYDPAAINRVLLFSDGNANVGDTDVEGFAALTRVGNDEGIYLSGVGVGADYDMLRMDLLTDAGKGAHVFVPDAGEVEVIFGRMLRKLIEVAADEVSVELALPVGWTLQGFSGEEVSTDPERRVPNVVLAAGDDLTMLASFVADDEAAMDGELLLTVRLRPLSTGVSARHDRHLPLRNPRPSLPSLLLRRTELVDRYARWGCTLDHGVDPRRLLADLDAFAAPDDGLAEIRALVARASD